MKDELTPLIEAYRAEIRGSSLDARALRERVLTATWRRRRLRLRRAVWLLPIAAVLVGTGALAASAPARESVSRVLAELGLVSPAVSSPLPARQAISHHAHAATLAPTPTLAAAPNTEVTTAASATAAATSVTVDVAAAPPPASITAAVSAEPVTAFTASLSLSPSQRATHARAAAVNASATAPSDQVVATPVASATSAATAPSPESPTAAASRTNADGRASAALAADIDTYRAAHELHFARADYARALVAWDRYLARFPHGTFTPEARLNRAVCLARLGKGTEAQASLRTLAESADAYTSSRARRLLAALSRD